MGIFMGWFLSSWTIHQLIFGYIMRNWDANFIGAFLLLPENGLFETNKHGGDGNF
jgi:hypothetical protein